jgi:hypothetical protein
MTGVFPSDEDTKYQFIKLAKSEQQTIKCDSDISAPAPKRPICWVDNYFVEEENTGKGGCVK